MKDICVKTVKRMTGLGNCCLLIGIFLPYITWDDWWNWIDGKAMSLLDIINETENVQPFVAMVISFFVSLIAVWCFGESRSLSASVFLLLTAVAGTISLNKYKEYIGDFMSQKGVGASILELSYIVLIISAVVALGVDICSLCSCKSTSVFIARWDGATCPRCGETVSPGSKFCDSCGFHLNSFCCPNCGTKRSGKGKYCTECGEQLPDISSAKRDTYSDDFEDFWICIGCGERNHAKMKICKKCGMNWN